VTDGITSAAYKKIMPIRDRINMGGARSWTQGRQIRHRITADYSVEDPVFRHTLGNWLCAPLIEGNSVVELLNGDKIFDEMLVAIRNAKSTITFETFIFRAGTIATRFVEAFSERARAGVKVLFIIDDFGSGKIGGKNIADLKAAGVQVEKYNPLRLSLFSMNHRTHRKLMVVDGRIGFIGGVCHHDAWTGNAEPGKWRDTHFRVEGPVVGQLQAAFADNWLQVRSEVLHGREFFPSLEPRGKMLAQAFKSGPREGAECARMTYLLSVAVARSTIRFAHAYFVPDDLLIDALVAARRRGVRIEIIVPTRIDNVAVKMAGCSRWVPLLEAGVEIYEYQPTLYHCKIMIVDDVWSIVGSVNIDDRSLRINDEANLNVMDRDFAAALVQSFEDDKSHSERLTAKEFERRGPLNKVIYKIIGAFRSQL
jgi:cardiolipin synthase A/B